MPQRLRDALGKDETVRVVIVDARPGSGRRNERAEPGAVIRGRWRSAAWKREPACASRLSTLRVMLSNGERIAANTVIGGGRAGASADRADPRRARR